MNLYHENEKLIQKIFFKNKDSFTKQMNFLHTSQYVLRCN